MKRTPETSCLLLIILLLTLGFPPELMHGQTAGDTGRPRGKPDARAWRKAREAGEKAWKEDKLAEARGFFQTALREAENFGARDYRLAESLEDLGEFDQATGNLPEAEGLYRRATEIRRGNVDHLLEAKCFIGLGLACRSLEHFDEAEKAFLHGEDVLAFGPGPGGLHRLLCRFYRAELYMAQGKFSQAEPLLKECRDGFQHPESIDGYPRTASTIVIPELLQYSSQGRGGLPYPATIVTPSLQVGRAMVMADAIRRPSYRLAIAVVTYQVALYAAQNRPVELDAAYRDQLKLMEDEMPAFAPPLQRVLQNYVDFLCDRHNFAAAAEAAKHAISIRERARKAKPESVAQARMLLAAIYEKEGRLPEAEALYREILDWESKVFGADSDEATEISLTLARFYMGHERYSEAEPVYLRLAARMSKYQGEGVALSAVLSAQESLYLKAGRDAELEAIYKRQITIYEKLYGADHPALTQPLRGYAALLRRQKREAEAQALEVRAARLKTPAPR